MPGNLTISTDPVRKQLQRGADKTHTHAHTCALTHSIYMTQYPNSPRLLLVKRCADVGARFKREERRVYSSANQREENPQTVNTQWWSEPRDNAFKCGTSSFGAGVTTTKKDSATERKTNNNKKNPRMHPPKSCRQTNVRQIECLNAEKQTKNTVIVSNNQPATGRISLKIIVNVESWPPALMG